MLRALNAYQLSLDTLSMFHIHLDASHWNYGCGYDCFFTQQHYTECFNRFKLQIQSVESHHRITQVGRNGECRNASAYWKTVVSELHNGNNVSFCFVVENQDGDIVAHESMNSYLHRSSAGDAIKVVEEYQQLMRQVWNVQPLVMESICDALKAENIAGSECAGNTRDKYIGVHIRRGDKSKDSEFIAIQKYASAVLFVLKEYESVDGAWRVVLVSDDYNAVVEFGEQLDVLCAGQSRYCEGVRVIHTVSDTRSGHVQRVWNNMQRQRQQQGVESTLQMLFEIELMKNADVLICTLSSNFARLAVALREKASMHSVLSLDNQWTPGVAFYAFRTSYCEDSSRGLFNSRFCASDAAAEWS